VTIGDFEHLEVPDHCKDALFSATAYHWLSRAAQLDRPATILKPGGLMSIVDLIQVDSPDDEGFFHAVQPIYERYGQGHNGPPAPANPYTSDTARVTTDHLRPNAEVATPPSANRSAGIVASWMSTSAATIGTGPIRPRPTAR
jgi:hypothetical protein